MSMQKLNFRVLSVLLNFLFGGARSESFVGGGGVQSQLPLDLLVRGYDRISFVPLFVLHSFSWMP
jgi:hypothetical protein